MDRVALVIPCYNEQTRLSVPEFQEVHLASGRLELVFVDDGSKDGTRSVIERIRGARPEDVRVVVYDENQGKAEAVRRGVLEAIRTQPDAVGYWDADFGDPPCRAPELREYSRESTRRRRRLGSPRQVDGAGHQSASLAALCGTSVCHRGVRHHRSSRVRHAVRSQAVSNDFATPQRVRTTVRVAMDSSTSKFWRASSHSIPAARKAWVARLWNIRFTDGRTCAGANSNRWISVRAVAELALIRRAYGYALGHRSSRA